MEYKRTWQVTKVLDREDLGAYFAQLADIRTEASLWFGTGQEKLEVGDLYEMTVKKQQAEPPRGK